MNKNNKKAFTMLELTFVIVIIGILSAVAIPKFAVTRDDATIIKAKTTIATIRNAISTERQKRILRGSFTPIFSLSSASGVNVPIFDGFNGDVNNTVLEYPLQSCATTSSTACWMETTTGSSASPTSQYTYNMPITGSVVFVLNNNRFDCQTLTDVNCIRLTR